jgi:phospho-N-acetylmuramoyl-pentapeptide-transferase
MLYNIFLPYASYWHLANLMTYITFRSGMAILSSLLISFVIGPKIISKLKMLQKKGQPIREDGPDSHFSKAGTPTMGGIIIISATLFSILLFSDLSNHYVWIIIFVLIMFGLLGFLDDYTKVSKFNYRGITAKKKLFFQFSVSLIAFASIKYCSLHSHVTDLAVPFFKTFLIDLGYFYFPFAMCVIIGSSNAVNLTDGLDGLAIGTVTIAASAFAIISYLVGNLTYANYLQIIYVPHVGELAVVCSALVGSGLGFLWYNCKPAEVFMGDTGSLSLGGVIGTISVITKHEIVLAIIGGIFVIETLSVIIQVYYFKMTNGKRFFKMAPIHHHFEKKGWSETKVVTRFWILAIAFALIGLSSLKLR